MPGQHPVVTHIFYNVLHIRPVSPSGGRIKEGGLEFQKI